VKKNLATLMTTPALQMGWGINIGFKEKKTIVLEDNG
jgi:hypothetical protein